MLLTPFSEKDYQGCFNLKALEKKMITSALRRTKDTARLAALLRKPEIDVVVAIVRHQIAI